MAITIISNLTSGKYYPSSNPVNVTVDSNNSGKCNFRYICDVYINGTKVFTDKLFPDPVTGYGFFQMSRVLQDYVQTYIKKSAYTSILNIAGSTTAPASAFSFYFKFGEEYDATVDCTGTIAQYTNLSTSATANIFESAIDYEYFPTFNGNSYLIATQSAQTKFLTNSQREIEVTYNDMYSLDFISNSTINTNYKAIIKTYDTSNTLVETFTASTTLAATKRYRVACGPYDINKVNLDPTVNPNINYYTVYLTYNTTQVSETFRFNVKPPKPFRTRIGFVGLLGSIEHFTFYHRKRKSYNIERKTYQKTLQSNYSGQWKYEVGDRGDSVYAVTAQETNQVASFCDKETSEWLYEMWLSPNAWTYLRPDLYSFRAFQDGLYVKFWVDGEHGLVAGDTIFCFTTNSDFKDLFTITSVNGNIVDCSLLYSVYGSQMTGTCGYVQKNADWQILPIVISDNVVEVKEKLSRPIEYTLNWRASYQKTTLRG